MERNTLVTKEVGKMTSSSLAIAITETISGNFKSKMVLPTKENLRKLTEHNINVENLKATKNYFQKYHDFKDLVIKEIEKLPHFIVKTNFTKDNLLILDNNPLMLEASEIKEYTERFNKEKITEIELRERGGYISLFW